MAEYLITSLSITAMAGSVSMVTSLCNGVYTLSERIIRSTDSGVADIKRLIESSDLQNRIEIMKLFVQETFNTENGEMKEGIPESIVRSIQAIKDAIKEIERELNQIQYRISYNDNLYFSAGGVRAYKFGNSYKRLDAKIKTLEKRYDTLRSLYSMRSIMTPLTKEQLEQTNSANKKELDEVKINLEKILTCEGDEYNVTESK